MYDPKCAKFIGVGAMFIKDNKVLLLHRSNTGLNDGMWGMIGGLVECNETPLSAVIREVKEEVGLDINSDDLRFVHCSLAKIRGQEFVGFNFVVKHWVGQPFNNEPSKHDKLEWWPLDKLPENMIIRNKKIIEMVQQGITYSEHDW